MPSLQEALEEARKEIDGWSTPHVGSQTWMRHRRKTALEIWLLIQKLMTVDHVPIADSIKDGVDTGNQFQTASCQLCKRDIDRYEDVDNNTWDDWRSIPEAARCFGLVAP
jgi:hypothetical protein